MTEKMMAKVAAAKEMVAYFVEHGLIGDGATDFYPAQYDEMRWQWDAETPTFATLKKYAAEIGLVAGEHYYAWHSDGSFLAAYSGIKEGAVFHYTAYHFE